MPLTHGAMPEWQKRKITRNFTFLKEEIDAKDLQDVFVDEGIFDIPDLDKINNYNPNTKENRNNCFFGLIFNAGERAYDVFIKALKENGREDVAERIVNTEVSHEPMEGATNDHLAWLREIPSKIQNTRLKERELSKLAQTLGHEWEMVALDMGLSQTDIEHAKMDQMTTPMRIYTCLNKWRVRGADKATFSNFIKIVNDCQATTIDWERIQRIVEEYSKENS